MKKYIRFRIKKPAVSYLVSKQALKVTMVLLLLSFAVFIGSAALGEMRISPLNVIKVFFGMGSEMDTLVIQSFRLPRIIIALFAGIALAVAGSILQGISRNPLASPDIIGIVGGASTAVVAFLAIFSDKNNALTVSIKWMPLAAFLGALIIGIVVYLLAWKDGISPLRLVLIGIGISVLMQSLTTLFMVVGPIYRANQANVWLTGTVYGSSWSDVQILVPWTVFLLLICVLMIRQLNIQELGEDLAKGVGSALQKDRMLLLLISTALTGGAVAFAGGLGFVGLMAPHIARRLVGSTFGALMPVSAMVGGILVMLADLAGRTLFSPLEVPAGVFTAAFGAPYFIYLLYKSKNQ
ncbi:iron ABC transporter permease [Bacillus tianshenii]|nr:iron ABC transporter permease [Bacillus tianshenii]